MALTPRKICGRRAAFEIKGGSVVNLGIGMPDSVASVANEEGISHQVTFSLETGVFGGVPILGVAFGAAVNPEALLSITDNLDMYQGGMLDAAILGLARSTKKQRERLEVRRALHGPRRLHRHNAEHKKNLLHRNLPRGADGI